MQSIQKILLENLGNRLTAELINGMYHSIAKEVQVLLDQQKAADATKSAKAGPKAEA